MSLKEELDLQERIETREHECILNIVYTGTMISKLSYKFFSQFGITDTQFNALMRLKYSRESAQSQSALSKRLIVNKADMTGVIDRLEKAQLVERVTHPTDRRVNLIKITKKGVALLAKIEPVYIREINKLTKHLTKAEMQENIKSLEQIRENVRKKGVI
ncbi:MAG: MarR family transcriptional regulator [Elusimicrobiota bacterium]